MRSDEATRTAIDMDVPKYTLGEVASAADVDAIVLQNWLNPKRSAPNHRVLILRERDRESRGTGHPRLFTLRRLLQIAITVQLVGLHVRPRQASEAALKFTDMSSRTPSGWAGEGRPDLASPASPMRPPGHLLNEGVTYLVIDRSEARVVDEKTMSEILRRETACTTINLNRIVERVYQRLGIEADHNRRTVNG
jgi:hypothetical protein